MKSIRENFPIIISWLGYEVCSTALDTILALRGPFLELWFSQKSGIHFLYIFFGMYALIEYLCFLASVRWVALPLFNQAKNIMKRPKQDLLFGKWLLFIIYVFIYNSPLFFIETIPITKIIGPWVILGITFIWKTAVSFSVYKDVVSSYLYSNINVLTIENGQQVPML